MAAAALALVGTFVWLLGGPPGPTAPARQEPRGIFEEKQLGLLKDPADPVQVYWSPDGKSWAYRAKVGDRFAMNIDGRMGEPFDVVAYPSFSPDGKTVAYVASDDGRNRYFIVSGATRGESFASITMYQRTRNPDGGYVWRSDPIVKWAPDGHAFAYIAKDKSGRLLAVVGNRKSEPFEEINSFEWSPDGRTYAFAARGGQDRFVVIGDRKGEIFDQVEHVTFSPDGKIVAYVAREGTNVIMIVNGSRQHTSLNIGPPVFSPDSRTLAYTSTTKDGHVVIVNGVADPKTFWPHKIAMSDPFFSPDGKRIGFKVVDDTRRSFVVDGKPVSEPFDNVEAPLFSPDGSTLAFVASRGRKHLAVVGGEIGEKFSSISAMTFSPDGKSVAYRADRFGKSFLVAGKGLSEGFDAVVSGPFYSPDSKKVAFVVRKGEELWSKVMEVK